MTKETMIEFATIAGSSIGTGLFTYVFARKKHQIALKQAEENLEGTQIENDMKLSSHYKTFLDDLKSRYETQLKEFESSVNRKLTLLEQKNKSLEAKIKLLKAEIVELKRENRKLKKK